MKSHVRIDITGIVQGVGFRPFIFNLAGKRGLKGYCLNDSQGVIIEVEGEDIEGFIYDIRSLAPPLSRIDELSARTITGPLGLNEFVIRESAPQEGRFALISPDLAICDDCLREMNDPKDRRHLYPFINCTNCGPRYSIIRDIPYDRGKTTMAPFRMCPECDREYHDPTDRRFHAQPNACPECGPKVWLEGESGDRSNYDAIERATRVIKEGAIVAIKGIGGFHLCCDAMNDGAVSRLRERKRRSNKPFAVMSAGMEDVRRICVVSDDDEALLKGVSRPIVILEGREGCGISSAVAPNNRFTGVMLPYTPIHHLLFSVAENSFIALVMTSGNLAEEPIVISNDEAMKRLSGIADHFLLHDRDIYMRVDDSIVSAPPRRPSVLREHRSNILRRARGYVPEPFQIREEMEDILACGGELKNTFCLTKGKNFILSQHIGDLNNYEALDFYRETLKNLRNTFRSKPIIVAHDMHPDYVSTSFAREFAEENGIGEERVVAVQHHHAHIVSCMAEHNLEGEVIGVSFDGTGFGDDGRIWGGEFLLAGRGSYRRKGHLSYIPIPGGDRGVKEPWRMAVSYLYRAFGAGIFDALPSFAERVGERDREAVLDMIRKGINSPHTSSSGRLFDAVSSIVGIRDMITFEGEAAIGLEMAAYSATRAEHSPYSFRIYDEEVSEIDLAPSIVEIVGDVRKGVPVGGISYRFHCTLAEIITRMAQKIRQYNGIEDVVLSGGTFQNRLLLRLTGRLLENNGFRVWFPERVPANDGGISLGQAVVAWEKVKDKNFQTW